MGAGKAAGQKAHLCKPWRLKEEGRFQHPFPCPAAAPSAAAAALAQPRAALRPKGLLGREAARWDQRHCAAAALLPARLCSAGDSSRLQSQEPQSLWAAGPAPEGQGAVVALLLGVLLGVLGCRPKLLFPSKLTSPLVHPL